MRKAFSFLLALVMIIGLFPMSSVVSAASSYTTCKSGTVSWQMIYDAPNTYYWYYSDKDTYCVLTAVTVGSKKAVSLTRPDKSETRYLKLTSDDDSGSVYDWGTSYHTGGVLYKSGSSSSTTYYTVTWKCYDDSYTYYSESVASGTTPAFDKTKYEKGTMPERGTGYTFIGWSTSTYADTAMALPPVTKDVTYYTAFSQTSVSSSADYVLVTTPTTGRKYIISNEDSNGTGYVLTGTGGTTTMTTKPSDSKYNTPYITATNENNVFTFTGSTSGFTLKNSSDSYLRFSAKETAPTTTGSGTTTFVYSSKTLYSNNYSVELKNNVYRFKKKTGSGGETVYFFEQQSTPATVDFTGTVVWDDGSDVCKKRPSNITVYLYKDNVYTNNYKTINGTSDTWTATWTGLEQGTYTISVTAPDGYAAAYSNSNKTVTLSRLTTRTFTTNVVWDDDNNAYHTRENYVNKLISSDTAVQEDKMQLIGYKDDGVTVRNNVTINGNTWSYLESSLPNIDYSIGTYTDTPATGCDYSISGNTITFTLKKYTVTWKNDDGTILETDTDVPYGSTPKYGGATPTKAANAQYTYTFSDWSPVISAVTGNITYTAQFDNTLRSYKVTWLNGDGTEFHSQNYNYGSTPTHPTNTPVKASDDTYNYIFTGWNKEPEIVTGAQTYTPQFRSELIQHEYSLSMSDRFIVAATDTVAVTEGECDEVWDENGFVYLKPTFIFKIDGIEQQVATNTTYRMNIISDDESILDSITNNYWLVFSKKSGTTTAKVQIYNAATAEVVAEKTITVTYNGIFTITWLDDNGEVIDTTSVAYGETPTHANPTKAATAQYTYTFEGWTPEIAAVTGDTTYTAAYSSTVNQYTVKFVNEDGTVLQSGKVAYGKTPAYTGETPTKTATAQYSYTFNNTWTPEIAEVTSDATYTAQFDSTVNEYTITWVDDDGTILKTDENVPYGTMPSYDNGTPEKESTSEFSYTFTGWTPNISEVTGNVKYTAVYSNGTNSYVVTWLDGDGNRLKFETVSYGTKPVYEGNTPTKAEPDDHHCYYVFNNTWKNLSEDTVVTGNVTFTAQFDEILRHKINIQDYTKNTEVKITGADGYYRNEYVTFTVDASVAVAFAQSDSTDYENANYQRLFCEQTDNGYQFTVYVGEEDIELVEVVKGDANLDGKCNLRDSAIDGQVYVGSYALNSLRTFASDLNADGKCNLRDAAMAEQIYVGNYVSKWDIKKS